VTARIEPTLAHVTQCEITAFVLLVVIIVLIIAVWFKS
jgi:hypothetical protein